MTEAERKESDQPEVSVVSEIKPRQDAARVSKRVGVLKTYKLYIGGKFPRTESGRYYLLTDTAGEPLANVSRASRKDVRESVVAARAAFPGWSARAAYNRGQILYRMAEMLESRRASFIEELCEQGLSKVSAETEVDSSIDRLVYYAGWCDKYQQIFSTVNPVSSSHFNFSLPEPMGVVAIIAPEKQGLLGLISTMAPAIAGGNSCIVLASESCPLSSVSLAEVLHSSDLPGGVVNILTGLREELLEHLSSHMDINAVVYCGSDPEHRTHIQKNATLNVKRVVFYDRENWLEEEAEGPYCIQKLQETKTTWHPIGT